MPTMRVVLTGMHMAYHNIIYAHETYLYTFVFSSLHEAKIILANT